MTATLEMKNDKSLHWNGTLAIYRHELNADHLTVIVPRYYGDQDLSVMQARICFSMGGMGDYAELKTVKINTTQITYSYAIGGALTCQGGEYRVWLEFHLWDVTANAECYCLCSEVETLTVLAHRDPSELLQPHHATFLTQLEERINAYEKASAELLEQALTTAEAANTAAKTADAAATSAKETADAAGKEIESLQAQMTQYFRNGNPRLLLGSQTVLTTQTVGDLAINDSNVNTQMYNFTFGMENKNGAWGGMVGGYRNQSTTSQQAVVGEGNHAPTSKNALICGQFCRTELENADGTALTNQYDPTRPLLVVGNGTSESKRSNAFAVYADGEAVLFDGQGALPIAKTLRAQQRKISALEQNPTGGTPTRSFCVGMEELYPTLSDKGFSLFQGDWSAISDSGTLQQAQVFRDFLLAWKQDDSYELYLDTAYTVAAGMVRDCGSKTYGTYWGYEFYFPNVGVSAYLSAFEVDDMGYPKENTLETATALSVRFAKGNCFSENDYLWKNEYTGSIDVDTATETESGEVVLDVTDAYQKVKAAGKRFLSMSFCYYLRGGCVWMSQLLPVYLDNVTGEATSVTGLQLSFEIGKAKLRITPALFGQSVWEDYGLNMGATLCYRFDLI